MSDTGDFFRGLADAAELQADLAQQQADLAQKQAELLRDLAAAAEVEQEMHQPERQQ
jgi:hypothetical protein